MSQVFEVSPIILDGIRFRSFQAGDVTPDSIILQQMKEEDEKQQKKEDNSASPTS